MSRIGMKQSQTADDADRADEEIRDLCVIGGRFCFGYSPDSYPCDPCKSVVARDFFFIAFFS